MRPTVYALHTLKIVTSSTFLNKAPAGILKQEVSAGILKQEVPAGILKQEVPAGILKQEVPAGILKKDRICSQLSSVFLNKR